MTSLDQFFLLGANPVGDKRSVKLEGGPMLPERLEFQLTCQLRQAGLRPTRQRLALARLLFGNGDRHVSAEGLHAEAVIAGEGVSLATVYNTLNQFKEAGLVRELAIDGAKSVFDTNTSNHNHFFLEDEHRLIDIPQSSIRVDGLPPPPDGMQVTHIDVIVRLVKAK